MVRRALCLAVLLLAVLTATAALGEALPSIRVAPASVKKSSSTRCVRTWHASGDIETYYLFLPSGWDTKKLRLWYDADEYVYLDGRKVKSGATTDRLRSGKTITASCGDATCTIKVMQSADVPSLHLWTASGSLEAIHQDKDHEETGSVTVEDAAGKVVMRQSLDSFRCRGHSSFDLP